MKVVKFGGSSLADSIQFKKAIRIILSDTERTVVVVSAPGKRNSGDEKITDLFYEWKRRAKEGISCQDIIETVEGRYLEIVNGLGLKFNVKNEIYRIGHVIQNLECGTAEYAASRGEYLSACIMAEALGFEYVHPEACIRFEEFGKKLIDEDDHIREIIKDRHVVIPGFYGAVKHRSDTIITFSRGGSDLTGAIIAKALKSEIYEIWTDVSGFLMCDPRIVENPPVIEKATYQVVRELSYMGANVLHEEAMFPVHKAGIPTNIRNTNDPDHPGTFIYSSLPHTVDDPVITGIAGRRGFAIITIEKMLMNKEIAFARKVLSVLEEEEISFEHMPGGIDTLRIVIDDKFLIFKKERLIERIQEVIDCDNIRVSTDVALIAVVGRRLFEDPKTTSMIFSALTENGICCLPQGSSELGIIIGVDGNRYESAIRAIYHKFS
jgi:aspartate kinase